MLASIGLMTLPCGVPSVAGSYLPSQIAPAFRKRTIRLTKASSAIRSLKAPEQRLVTNRVEEAFDVAVDDEVDRLTHFKAKVKVKAKVRNAVLRIST